MEQLSLVMFEDKHKGCEESKDLNVHCMEHSTVISQTEGLDDDSAIINVREQGDTLRDSHAFKQLHNRCNEQC